MLAPFDYEEEGTQSLMADRDDRPLVAAAHDEGLELRLEHRGGATGGMSELAEQTADIRIALANVAGLALAGRLVVAGANSHPGGQAMRAAEGIHIGANLGQQHGRTDQIDAWDRLEQGQNVSLGFKFAEQANVEAGDTRFDLLDMSHQLIEHKAVARRQIALQGIEQFLPAGFQPTAGELEYLVRRLSVDDRLNHGAGRLAMQVADHDAEAHTAIGQHLVQAILLGGQLADQFLALTRNQAQLPQFRPWHERSAQQPRPCQRRQPVGIAHIRLASRHVLDMPRIHHLRTNARRLQRRIRTVPVDAGTFHHDFIGPEGGDPIRQFPAVTFDTISRSNI